MRRRIVLLAIAALILTVLFSFSRLPVSLGPVGATFGPAEEAGVVRPLRERLGVNVVYANVPADVARVAGWVRDYHRWYWYETERDRLTWHSGKQRLDQFYSALKDLGVPVMVNVGMVPAWASSNGANSGLPHSKGVSGSKPVDYRAHSEYIGQLAARYGSTGHNAGLRSTDGLSGMASVKAIEGWNEPNQNWAQPRFAASAFAAMVQADYDGAGMQARAESPLLGIKQGDPAMLAVLPGLAGLDVAYLDQANTIWKGAGRLPFDALNFHWFAKGQAGSGGKAPEAGGLMDVLQGMKQWRDRAAPRVPIWLTEFGWDTGSRGGGHSSPLYAPEATAANYLIRAIMVALANGADRVFVFTYRDNDSDSGELYSTAGLVENSTAREGEDSRKKAGWYALATLQQLLGSMTLQGVVRQGDGEPAVYAYRWGEPGGQRQALVAWVRNPRVERDDGTTLDGHELPVPEAVEALVTTLGVASATGSQRPVEVSSPGSNGAIVRLSLSEAPVIIEYRKGHSR